jgi:hypothetical protein
MKHKVFRSRTWPVRQFLVGFDKKAWLYITSENGVEGFQITRRQARAIANALLEWADQKKP